MVFLAQRNTKERALSSWYSLDPIAKDEMESTHDGIESIAIFFSAQVVSRLSLGNETVKYLGLWRGEKTHQCDEELTLAEVS